MALDPKKLSTENIEQLALGLVIDEVEVEDSISPAEAKQRSEAAFLAMKVRMTKDESVAVDAAKAHLTVPGNLILWSADFYQLQDAGWPWRVAAYIAWASCPRRERYPRTQEDLANDVLGLTSDRQISKWRKNNSAIDEMIGIMQAAPLMDQRRRIFEALVESASDPSFHGAQDRKTALTMTGDYVPHMKVEIPRKPGDPLQMSDEELDEEIKRLEVKKNDRD